LKILFLDKVLMGAMPSPLRGVEIFNTRLIGDLARCGDQITVPVHASWVDYLASEAAGEVHLLPVSAGKKPLLNGITAAWKLRKQRYDVLLLANVANGLLPAAAMLRRSGAVGRCVLIAHREPSRRFLRAQKRIPTRVVSVNRIIADEFRAEGGYELSDVYYGITNGDSFRPVDGRGRSAVRFCVVGQLDNPWKGADTAVAALREMRLRCGVECELHLASFSDPAPWKGAGVVPYSWMPASRMPEFLGGMDVMIVPSRDEGVMRETFSQVAVQGMLSGLPLIVSDRPVLTEKLDAGGGRVFHNMEELAGHMAELASDAELRARLGAEGRKTALERYVWDTTVFREKYLV
jgi:glycosyltransferase involved in cell wall biosynthesis